LQVSAWSYGWALQHEFRAEHDPSELLGEKNVFRYQPRRRVLLRCNEGVGLDEVMLGILAAMSCEVELELSLDPKHAKVVGPTLNDLPQVRVTKEPEEALIARLAKINPAPELVRYPGAVPLAVYEQANDWHVPVIDDPVELIGRLELRFYFREQSVSETVHRYGNLIDPPAGGSE
jgi:RHH-type proline utilization regulon transcriptional repressor/proline dehydrogenase/delta 1-pyrroline-5-carboxylate dehydrogenase